MEGYTESIYCCGHKGCPVERSLSSDVIVLYHKRAHEFVERCLLRGCPFCVVAHDQIHFGHTYPITAFKQTRAASEWILEQKLRKYTHEAAIFGYLAEGRLQVATEQSVRMQNDWMATESARGVIPDPKTCTFCRQVIAHVMIKHFNKQPIEKPQQSTTPVPAQVISTNNSAQQQSN